MKLTTELIAQKEKALIICKTSPTFVEMFKKILRGYDLEVFTNPELPDDYSQYTSIYFIQETSMLVNDFLDFPDKKFVFVFFGHDDLARTYREFAQDHHALHIKVINLDTSPHFFKDDIDAILWFVYSRSSENYLYIYHPPLTKLAPQQKSYPIPKKKRLRNALTPKKIAFLLFFLFMFIHTAFIPPLLLASYFNARAGQAIIQQKMSQGQQFSATSQSLYRIGLPLFSIAKPVLSLFSLSFYPENIFQLNQAAYNIAEKTAQLEKSAKILSQNILNKDKTPLEAKKFYEEKDQFIRNFGSLHQDIQVLQAKIPDWHPQAATVKKDLEELLKVFSTIETLLPQFDTLFAKDSTKKYLLLFANNKELRPGGGFIGSFGVITLKDYSIQELKIYDVYDADGQLKEVVEPPEPIKKYLNQPYWYLRDSAFSPDFVKNYQQATFFLDKELGMYNFDGGILLTTTTIQNILAAMPELYIPDFQEKITKDNFYIKAQQYAEKDFFPGSTQKKQFLGSVLDQLLLDIGNASFPQLMLMIKKSLDEKQMVIYLQDPAAQSTIDSLYWSGRVITPQCTNQRSEGCLVDSIFAYDANVGVNKANFFVTKPTTVQVTIDNQGKVNTNINFQYTNNSYNNVFPGGTYKNYFQIALPLASRIQKISLDNQPVNQYEEKLTQFREIGFYMEVPPQKTMNLTIQYDLENGISRGNATYQLVMQKQIGSSNSDVQLSFKLDPSISLKNKNFSPLVKGNEIIYNTSIASDKIFILDLYRE